MARDGLSNGATFWGMVGAVMVALKLKERYDDYSTLPADEEGFGHGPVSLPNLDENAVDGASLLDTQLSGRPKRQRKPDCCMCCGLRCGLFWKAFGIVCLLFVGWQVLRFTIWAVTPSPTGLEGMPEFGTSLGCRDAPFLYEGGRQDISVGVGKNQDKGDHSMDFRGAGVGTIVLAQGEADLKDIKYEITLRTDNAKMLDNVMLDVPTPEEIEQNTKSSRLQLMLPGYDVIGTSCVRFDATVYLPPTVKTLHVQSHVSTHLKFDPDSNFNFNKLTVTLYHLDDNNVLIPTEGIHANQLSLQVSRGWLVGDVTVVDKAELLTQRANATMNIRVHPAPSSAEPPAPVKLTTSTGAGRTDLAVVNHAGFPHRPITAMHHSSMNGAMYLTYKEASFNGTVDLTAGSFSATGLSNAFKQEPGMPYVGSQQGGDKMTVKTQGWAGLYF